MRAKPWHRRGPRYPPDLYQKGNPVDDKSVAETVLRRADQLIRGDRIPESQLIYKFNKGPAEVVFLADEPEDSHTFIAYRYPNRCHESMTVRSEAVLQVYPVGHDYSRADDGEQPGPVAGRIPPHFEDGRAVVEVAGGLVEVDPPEGFVPASAPVAGGLTPIHFGFLGMGTACGGAEGSVGRSQVSVWAGVTCEKCLEQAPAST
jgi:hypothetical protein